MGFHVIISPHELAYIKDKFAKNSMWKCHEKWQQVAFRKFAKVAKSGEKWHLGKSKRGI